MKIAMAQLNPVVGDIKGNLQRLDELWAELQLSQTDLIIFPELFLVGYPPRDLLERPAFLERAKEAIQQIIQLSARYEDTGILMGAPTLTGNEKGHGLHNSALLICNGKILHTQSKSLLPAYGTFDETSYFDPAEDIEVITFKDFRLGILIGEDAWNEPRLWKGGVFCNRDPLAELAQQGVDLVINISASPYFLNKEAMIGRLMSKHARNLAEPLIYLNQVGANDELIFDGQSRLIDKYGEISEILPAFKEAVRIVQIEQESEAVKWVVRDERQYLYEALVLGIRDYFKKTEFSRAIIGLSGGIDSAVVACLAVAALGHENVLGVTLPSLYSSQGSIDDSLALAKNLDIECKVIPINEIYEIYLDTLSPHFAGREADVTEENVQARIRGNLLMTLANKYGAMVLTTGNKSEIAVGYCTLYGDMCGGLGVLSDVPKTVVYELTSYINQEQEVIPQSTVAKAPSAELRPGQTDQDTLPPYPILDAILNCYIEENLSADDIIAQGYDPDTVSWVLHTVNKNEYKRKQAAPGLKVSTRAFGARRRNPIAARYEI